MTCPLEDVGGLSGHYKFCDIMRDKNHKEYAQSLRWINLAFNKKNYNPKKFDHKDINIELLKYLRWSRERSTLSFLLGD